MAFLFLSFGYKEVTSQEVFLRSVDYLARERIITEEIERTSVGLQAEAARTAGLATVMESLPPTVAFRALANAQRANLTLEALIPQRNTPESELTLRQATRQLRSISAAMEQDATRLSRIVQRAPSEGYGASIRSLSALQLSDVSRSFIDLARSGTGIIVAPGSPIQALGPPASLGGATPYIVRGVYTSDYPAVAGIVRSDAGGRLFIDCSATLIAPNAVLTARHCVDGTSNPAPPSAVFFQHAGLVGLATTRPLVPYPRLEFPHGDLAIVFLERDITEITPARLNDLEPLPAGTRARAVGFGFRSGASLAGTASAGLPIIRETGLKLHAAVLTSACPGDYAGSSLICWVMPRNSFHANVGSTCQADSGGPLFANIRGVMVLAGVTTAGDADCQPQTISLDTEVFAYVNSWLRAELNARPPMGSMGWRNPLDPVNNSSGRYIIPQSSDYALLDDSGNIETPAFQMAAGTSLLRVSVNGSGNPLRPIESPLRRLEVRGPNGVACQHGSLSLFLVCDIENPTPGNWSFQITGNRTSEIPIVAISFSR
jgi:hypothetical protein